MIKAEELLFLPVELNDSSAGFLFESIFLKGYTIIKIEVVKYERQF